MIRAHRLNGASFRRQVPIGPYIADFVCPAASLVVEIDGGQHYERDGIARDQRRDAFLKMKGFRVLRFSNLDVMTNRAGVAEVIAEAVASTSPARGGGGEQSEREGVNSHESFVRAPSLTLPRKRGRGPTARA
jgi:very-short-patch-repair endonuclease